MNRQFEKIIKLHEKQDSDYIYSADEVLERVKKEFANADEFIAVLKNDKDFAAKFFDYSLRPVEYPVLPVKKTDGFYIKKHTATQTPYFHKHLFYEMIYVHKGKSVQYFPDGKQALVSEKQIAIIPPDVIHAMAKCKENVIFKIAIPVPLFEQSVSETPELKRIKDMKIFGKADETAQSLIYSLMREDYNREENWLGAVKNYLSLLFIELLRTSSAQYGQVKETVENYFLLGLKGATLKGFAKYAGYSAGYAGRLIKKTFGRGFNELLGEQRLAFAKTLLSQSDMSVENIALEVGYNNASGFYKLFCNTYGMTPKDYRKALQ